MVLDTKGIACGHLKNHGHQSENLPRVPIDSKAWHVLQQHDDAPAEAAQDSDAEHAVTASADMEADSPQPRQHPWPPPTPLNCALPDVQGSFDISPDGKGGPM